jgi:hypothetical protein
VSGSGSAGIGELSVAGNVAMMRASMCPRGSLHRTRSRQYDISPRHADGGVSRR